MAIVHKCMYGLTQAGRLTKEKLSVLLARHDYHQATHLKCRFRHKFQMVSWLL